MTREELQNSVTSIILDIDYKYDYDSYLDRLLNLVELNEFFENDGYWYLLCDFILKYVCLLNFLFFI
jgi:hypothetical protein